MKKSLVLALAAVSVACAQTDAPAPSSSQAEQTGQAAQAGFSGEAQFEFAAARTSESVWSVIGHLRRDATERELARHLRSDGLPYS